MKKFISFILCLIILISVLPGTVEVYAEESSDEYNTYFLEALISNNLNGHVYTGQKVDLDITTKKNRKLVGYIANDCVYISVYNSSGILCSSNMFSQLSGYFSNLSGVTQRVEYSVGDAGGEYIIKSTDIDSVNIRLNWSYGINHKSGKLKTNIPLFKSEADVQKFINGEIDITQAENFTSDILNRVVDSSEVPLPRNLHIAYEDYHYYIVWEYSSEDLKKISLVFIDGMPMEVNARLKNFKDYMYCPIAEDLDSCIKLDEYLEPRLSYKLDITDDITRLRDGIENILGTKYDYQVTIDYWILARWDKSELDMYFSNFAHVKVYISDSDEGFKVDFDNTVTDSNGNVLDDVQFNTGLSSGNGISSNNFLGNIASGFNLLGDNGLIALLTSTLAFIPSQLWMIIGTALSIMVIIALFKLVIK